MARKTATVTISDPASSERPAGRDHGKQFHLTEMPALQTERWATRALLALAASGVVLPEGWQDAGAAALAGVALSALAGVSYHDLAPLLNEMLECVEVLPDPKNHAVRRPLGSGEDDIEEVSTYLTLRREVFNLHMDFSQLAALLKSRQASETGGRTSPIQTSPPASE